MIKQIQRNVNYRIQMVGKTGIHVQFFTFSVFLKFFVIHCGGEKGFFPSLQKNPQLRPIFFPFRQLDDIQFICAFNILKIHFDNFNKMPLNFYVRPKFGPIKRPLTS